MTKPISPKDVADAKAKAIPDEVIDAANQLLAEKWDGHAAKFTLKELCVRARQKLGEGYAFQSWELDIEVPFGLAGWIVKFDKPAYNESYDANFTFQKRRTRG